MDKIWNTVQQGNLLITFENRDISNINPNHKSENKIITTKPDFFKYNLIYRNTIGGECLPIRSTNK